MPSTIDNRTAQLETLKRVQKAHRSRERIRASEVEASHALAQELIAARKAGVPVAELARTLDLTRKAIYDLIAWHTGEKAART